MEKEELIKVLKKIHDFKIDNFSEFIVIDVDKGYRAYRCPICKEEYGEWGLFDHLKEHKEFEYLNIIPSNPNNWVEVILNLLENNTMGQITPPSAGANALP